MCLHTEQNKFAVYAIQDALYWINELKKESQYYKDYADMPVIRHLNAALLNLLVQ